MKMKSKIKTSKADAYFLFQSTSKVLLARTSFRQHRNSNIGQLARLTPRLYQNLRFAMDSLSIWLHKDLMLTAAVCTQLKPAEIPALYFSWRLFDGKETDIFLFRKITKDWNRDWRQGLKLVTLLDVCFVPSWEFFSPNSIQHLKLLLFGRLKIKS